VRRRNLPVLLAGVVAGLTALLAPPVVASADQSQAQLRMGYFSSDAPNVDFYVDGQRAWSNVGYKTISNYIDVAPGQHSFLVRTAGSAADSAPVAQAQGSLNAGTFYTAFASGKTGELKAAVFSDTFSTPPSGKTVARFVHLAPEVPAVDVAVKGGPVVFNSIGFMQGSQYATVDAGTYNLELHQAGTDKVLFTADGVQLSSGMVQTAIGSGGVGRPVELVKVQDAGASATAPSGGAATGGGGMALRQAAGLAPVALGLVAAALLLAFGRRRRVAD
jgi:hypothetical protein